MMNLLIVLLLSIANSSCAETDRQSNPALESGATQYVQPEQATDPKNDAKGRALLMEVLYFIKNAYYKEIDLSVCVPKILTGGVSQCTDRYSFYLDPVQAKEERDNFTNGELVGIGATLEVNKDGGLKVLDVIEESPSEKAGLLVNDIIIAVASDGDAVPEVWTALNTMPLNQAIKLIRGKKGTKVSLMIVRNGEKKKFPIIRDTVKIVFLKSKILKEKVGYIRISSFGGEVSAQFYKAMEKLNSAGVKSAIIDLRNNGGGKLDSVLMMCAFLAKTDTDYATILYVKDRDKPLQDIGAGGSGVGKYKDMSIIILQNGNSASASEIFSGYLQSEAGAIVIGEKSFGKGIVQSLIPLTNNGELHLTISEYFIGRKLIKVHNIGILPNIGVKQSKPIKTEEDDEQLQRAIQEAEKLLK